MQETKIQTEKPATTRQQRKNNSSRRRWLDRLAEQWPQAFNLTNPRPLAVGIIDDITAVLSAAGAGGHGAVRYALKSYTGNIRYVRAVATGGPRYDLTGQPRGEVTPTERQHAAERLEAMKQAKAHFSDQVAI